MVIIVIILVVISVFVFVCMFDVCVWVGGVQMQPQPWPCREGGWNGGGRGGETQMRAAWLFNDPISGKWTIALDYIAQPCSPIYQVRDTSVMLMQ